MTDYTSSERTDVPEDGKDIVVTQGHTVDESESKGSYLGTEWIESEDEGYARVNGISQPAPEYRGYALPGDEPLVSRSKAKRNA